MDFRVRAVAASEILRCNLPSGLSHEKCGVSCCLVRQPDLSRLRTPIKVITVAALVVGLSGLATGTIIVLLLKGSMAADKSSVPAIAFSCGTIVWILSMFLPTFIEGRIVRHHLPQREEDSTAGSDHKGIHVALEHAPTYGAIKILPEDVGLIYIHPEACYVRISGLSYDYIIQSKDVAGLSLHSNGKSVLLSYKVGKERLDLVIVPRSLLAALKHQALGKRQALGSSQSLFAKIQQALGQRRSKGIERRIDGYSRRTKTD
jgi:hypothetical protein